jgi:hypothetical protein
MLEEKVVLISSVKPKECPFKSVGVTEEDCIQCLSCECKGHEEDIHNGVCEECFNDGINGGCSKCESWPEPEPINIEGVEYYFITNAEKNDELHRRYRELRKKKIIKALFIKATNMAHKPMPEHIGIWLSTKDAAVVHSCGLYVRA